MSINPGEHPHENIAAGDYPVSRSLFFYVKNARVGVIPGIQEYVEEFTSEGPMAKTAISRTKG